MRTAAFLLPDTDDIEAALEGMTDAETSVPDDDFRGEDNDEGD